MTSIVATAILAAAVTPTVDPVNTGLPNCGGGCKTIFDDMKHTGQKMVSRLIFSAQKNEWTLQQFPLRSAILNSSDFLRYLPWICLPSIPASTLHIVLIKPLTCVSFAGQDVRQIAHRE